MESPTDVRERQLVELSARLRDAYEARDVGRLMELFADDAELS
jgi:hypothetical protein